MTDTNRDTDDGSATDQPSTDATTEPDAGRQPGRSSPASDGGNVDDVTASADDERERRRESDAGRDIGTYVEWAAFAILCLLALVATFRFYFAASEAIRVWFSADFVPVFQAVFNLLVLVASAAGISVLVRRIA